MGEWQIDTYERSNKAQTFSNLHNSYVPKDLWKAELSIHVVKYICIFKGVQLKSRL